MAGEFRKGQWTKGEDEQLLGAVEKHGQRWTVVATCVSTRSAEQCAKRWQQSLNPELDRSEWTPGEDHKLMEAVSAIGRQWTQIQRLHFPDRSKNAIKNRYTIVSRKLRKQAQRQSTEGPKQSADIVMADVANENESGDDGSEEGDSEMSDSNSVQSGLRHVVDSEHHPVQASSRSSPSMTEFTTRSNSWTQFDPMIAATQPAFLESTILAPSQPPADPSQLWMWDPTLAPTAMGVDPTSNMLENDITNLDLIMPDSGRASIVSDGLDFSAGLGGDSWQSLEANAVTVKLTLDNPNSETMQSLMKIAIDNKARFRVERD
jgi:myb proto-oncogene protein